VLLGGCTGLILLVFAGATVGVTLNLRETALRGAQTARRNLSFVLAEQADRSLPALDLMLGGIVAMPPAPVGVTTRSTRGGGHWPSVCTGVGISSGPHDARPSYLRGESAHSVLSAGRATGAQTSPVDVWYLS